MHRGRVFERAGDDALVEFRSIVDAVRLAVEIQIAMIERNAGLAPDQRAFTVLALRAGVGAPSLSMISPPRRSASCGTLPSN